MRANAVVEEEEKEKEMVDEEVILQNLQIGRLYEGVDLCIFLDCNHRPA